MEWNNVKEDGNPGYYWQMLEAMAQHYHIDMNTPFKDLTAEERELILHGTKAKKCACITTIRMAARPPLTPPLKGHRQPGAPLPRTNSEYIREKISEYMSDRPCPTAVASACAPKRWRSRWMRQHSPDHRMAGATLAGLGHSTSRLHSALTAASVPSPTAS